MIETVFDIEANGLLRDATKIHCFCWKDSRFSGDCGRGEVAKLFADPNFLWVGHNIVAYDFVVIQRLWDIPPPKNYVDTLALSWYLQPGRPKYGLDSYGTEYGVPKPKVDDWENLTREEYIHRCSEDCKINWRLWLDLKNKLQELYT